MKFQFCGGNDCPEWVIANIAIVSKLTVIQLRLTLNLLVKNITTSNTLNIEGLRKRCKNLKTDSEANALYATLIYILKASSRFNISDAILTEELEQMGLSYILAKSVQRSYVKEKEKIAEWVFKSSSFGTKEISNVDWSIFHIISSSKLPQQESAPVIELQFDTNNVLSSHLGKDKIQLSLNQFTLLHHGT